MNEIDLPIRRCLSRIQAKKAQHLIDQNKGQIIGVKIHIKTDTGTCEIDEFGRAIWLTDTGEEDAN